MADRVRRGVDERAAAAARRIFERTVPAALAVFIMAGCSGGAAHEQANQQPKKAPKLPRCSRNFARETLISNQVTCVIPGRRPTVRVITYLARPVELDGYRLTVGRHVIQRPGRSRQIIVIAHIAVRATAASPTAAPLYALSETRLDCGSGPTYLQDPKVAARESRRDVFRAARHGPLAPGEQRAIDVVIVAPSGCHDDVTSGTALLSFIGRGVTSHGFRAIVGVFLTE